MANQDSGLIQVSGLCSASIVGKMYYNSGLISLLVANSIDASGKQNGPYFTNMNGNCFISINTEVIVRPNLINLSGVCSINLNTQVLVNAYASIYGFLSSKVRGHSFCPDLFFDKEITEIIHDGCSIKGESLELIRYRGDTYPLVATLAKKGDYNIDGHTFKMSTQIADGTIYESVGTILNSSAGLVQFILEASAVDVTGNGTYDIEGNDGTYIYTYEKGIFTLLDDLTV